MQNHISLRRLRRLYLLPALALASACDEGITIQPDVLAGSYAATSFLVTQTGQPYLVIEYVEGETITKWCDSRELDVAARVRLFLDVLAAVAHAHAHRAGREGVQGQ